MKHIGHMYHQAGRNVVVSINIISYRTIIIYYLFELYNIITVVIKENNINNNKHNKKKNKDSFSSLSRHVNVVP